MKNLKLSLSLKFKGQVPEFVLSPSPDFIVDESLYEFTVDPTKIFKFSINVNHIVPGSALIIDKIDFNGTVLNYIDSFGIYKTCKGIKKTYGYMDEEGTYTFKLRSNPISHNYLYFLLDSK